MTDSFTRQELIDYLDHKIESYPYHDLLADSYRSALLVVRADIMDGKLNDR